MMELNEKIDFDGHTPFYLQLKGFLQRRIDEGVWTPNEMLPSESQLCAAYDISRTVVRQALREMEYEGQIYRRKGKGTFVAEPKILESLAQRLTGFHQDMAEQGLSIGDDVLFLGVVPADGKVAGFLKLDPGVDVIKLRRLRHVEGAPIALVTTYLPASLCGKVLEADFRNQSLYVFLERECGLVIDHGRRMIEAVAANEEEAGLMQVRRGAPMVLLDSISYLEDGLPVEYYHAVHRGDRTRFEIELVRYREKDNLDAALTKRGEKMPPSIAVRQR
ncbi:MAG: GntR family transcriptional regulator [Anaerolineaceae bacterium]|jgi:GntR family transcriptional regulator|nr:GntR family transcriptional regulator [Anaerolineaceae bacterium]